MHVWITQGKQTSVGRDFGSLSRRPPGKSFVQQECQLLTTKHNPFDPRKWDMIVFYNVVPTHPYNLHPQIFFNKQNAGETRTLCTLRIAAWPQIHSFPKSQWLWGGYCKTKYTGWLKSPDKTSSQMIWNNLELLFKHIIVIFSNRNTGGRDGHRPLDGRQPINNKQVDQRKWRGHETHCKSVPINAHETLVIK